MESSAETACTGKGLMPLAKRRIVKSAMSHKELNLSLFGRPWTTMECFYKEDNMFVRAQAGDMLMVRFQCDICHFRNLAKRLPDPGQPKEDEEILEHIWRTNLDAFWARESSMVKKNLGVLLQAESCFERLELDPVSPPFGTFPFEDTLGMKAAIAVLDKWLDPGLYEGFVQWETFWKTRLAITNVHQASPLGLGDALMMYEQTKTTDLQCSYTQPASGIHGS